MNIFYCFSWKSHIRFVVCWGRHGRVRTAVSWMSRGVHRSKFNEHIIKTKKNIMNCSTIGSSYSACGI